MTVRREHLQDPPDRERAACAFAASGWWLTGNGDGAKQAAAQSVVAAVDDFGRIVLGKGQKFYRSLIAGQAGNGVHLGEHGQTGKRGQPGLGAKRLGIDRRRDRLPPGRPGSAPLLSAAGLWLWPVRLAV